MIYFLLVPLAYACLGLIAVTLMSWYQGGGFWRGMTLRKLLPYWRVFACWPIAVGLFVTMLCMGVEMGNFPPIPESELDDAYDS